MTFLNRRIIQQPTLFASSRRNFGNLLEKYETGQNSTSGSGRQLASILPEPTFTTNWTKSGLTINADISSITDAHPEFYAYLCRDDGTTLATYQFAEGQNATALSHTEANYETFSYQLKLGTTSYLRTQKLTRDQLPHIRLCFRSANSRLRRVSRTLLTRTIRSQLHLNAMMVRHFLHTLWWKTKRLSTLHKPKVHTTLTTMLLK